MKRKRLAVIVGLVATAAIGWWIFFPATPTIHFVRFEERPGSATFEMRNDADVAFHFLGYGSRVASYSAQLKTPDGVRSEPAFFGCIAPTPRTIQPHSSLEFSVFEAMGGVTALRIGVEFKVGPAEDAHWNRNVSRFEAYLRSLQDWLFAKLPKLDPTWSEFVPVPPAHAGSPSEFVVSEGP